LILFLSFCIAELGEEESLPSSIVLIVVGLGGLLTSDQEEWECSGTKSAKKVVKKAVHKRKK